MSEFGVRDRNSPDASKIGVGLNEGLVVRRSPYGGPNGNGVFATRTFQKNERITWYQGRRVSFAETERLKAQNQHFHVIPLAMKREWVDGVRGTNLPSGTGLMSLTNDLAYSGGENNARKIVYRDERNATDWIVLVATREIQYGEEIGWAYMQTPLQHTHEEPIAPKKSLPAPARVQKTVAPRMDDDDLELPANRPVTAPRRRRADPEKSVPRASIFGGPRFYTSGPALLNRVSAQLGVLLNMPPSEHGLLQMSLYGINAVAAGDIVHRARTIGNGALVPELLYLGLHRLAGTEREMNYLAEQVAEFTTLEHLHVAACTGLVSELTPRRLAENMPAETYALRNLISLYVFDDGKVDGGVWEHLCKIPNLLYLAFVGCKNVFTFAEDAGIRPISFDFEKFRWVLVGKNQSVAIENFSEIAKYSPFHGTVRRTSEIELIGNGTVSDAVAMWLLCEIQFSAMKERIVLRRIGLKPKHLRLFALIADASPALSHLDVRENEFDVDSMNALISMARNRAGGFRLRIGSPGEDGVPYPINALMMQMKSAYDPNVEAMTAAMREFDTSLSAEADPDVQALLLRAGPQPVPSKTRPRWQMAERRPADVMQLVALEKARRARLTDADMLDMPPAMSTPELKKPLRRAKKTGIESPVPTFSTQIMSPTRPQASPDASTDEETPIQAVVLVAGEQSERVLHPNPPQPVAQTPLYSEARDVTTGRPEMVVEQISLSSDNDEEIEPNVLDVTVAYPADASSDARVSVILLTSTGSSDDSDSSGSSLIIE